MKIAEIFPPIENAIEMEPEELAPFVLKYLSFQQNINRYNITLNTNEGINEYSGDKRDEFLKKLIESLVWLEKEIFIAPEPGKQGEWYYITKRGNEVLRGSDFNSYIKSSLLPSGGLDPILVRKVKPLYIRGDYDTAIFQAFKEVEVRVRKRAKLSDDDYGVDLMRKAFKPNNEKLADKKTNTGEQVAKMELFAGAIGLFKNPSSHRYVKYNNPNEAADIIHIANELLRILDSIKSLKKLSKEGEK